MKYPKNKVLLFMPFYSSWPIVSGDLILVKPDGELSILRGPYWNECWEDRPCYAARVKSWRDKSGDYLLNWAGKFKSPNDALEKMNAYHKSKGYKLPEYVGAI